MHLKVDSRHRIEDRVSLGESKANHIKHRPEKIQCYTCGKKFSSKPQIERHLTTLTFKVLCKCLVCQRFYYPGNYCDHEDDSKVFHCELCGVQLEQPYHLHSCFHLNAKKIALIKNHREKKKSLPKIKEERKKVSNPAKKRKEALPLPDVKDEPIVVKLDASSEYPNDNDDLKEELKSVIVSDTDNLIELPDPSSDIDDTDTCIYCDMKMPTVLLSKHESWHRKFDKNVRSLTDTRSSRRQRNTEGLCAYCGVIKPGNKLRRHEYVEHVKKYVRKVCDICGIFTCPTYIKEHMRTHDAEKGFKCDDCGKAFFRKKALARHRLVHTDVAQYMCTVCGKSFKIKFNLRVHMRTHEDIKPFPCSVCKKTFTTKQWRDNHLKTHGIVVNR